jgi:hypothetical protein
MGSRSNFDEKSQTEREKDGTIVQTWRKTICHCLITVSALILADNCIYEHDILRACQISLDDARSRTKRLSLSPMRLLKTGQLHTFLLIFSSGSVTVDGSHCLSTTRSFLWTRRFDPIRSVSGIKAEHFDFLITPRNHAIPSVGTCDERSPTTQHLALDGGAQDL